MELLLATRNAHKTRELAGILGERFRVSDLSAAGNVSVVEENGDSFEANAILKAIAASKNWPGFVVADDSGLEVDALNGGPGIFSARYAGEEASDAQNVEKLLQAMAEVRDRSARFRCVMAVAQNGEILRTVEGIVEGVIVDLPRGKGGFGYDPIFQPNGFDRTFGELPDEIKNRISHRARAAQELLDFLARRKV